MTLELQDDFNDFEIFVFDRDRKIGAFIFVEFHLKAEENRSTQVHLFEDKVIRAGESGHVENEVEGGIRGYRVELRKSIFKEIEKDVQRRGDSGRGIASRIHSSRKCQNQSEENGNFGVRNVHLFAKPID